MSSQAKSPAVPLKSNSIVIERFYTPGLAQVAYGIADPTTGTAAIIDPRRDIDDYLVWASDNGFRITSVLETHVHADFVSGARELAAATGATIYAGRTGESEFSHRPLDDGDVIPVGNLALRAFWTPGHTPEHMSYLLIDATRRLEPLALFSGDVLFAGEIGRPDLLGSERQQVLIEQLFETVHERPASLPDDTIVFPGHGAGSPCGKKIGDAARSTIGQEKRFNYAFQAKTRDEFVHDVMSGMPQPPAYYPTMKRVNKVGPALQADLAPGGPLVPEEVASLQEQGALLIDGRTPEAFAAEHTPGSVNIPLGPSFVIWAGWLTPYDRPVVLILPRDSQYPEARVELRRIGTDDVEGYLKGGIAAWLASGRPVSSFREMSLEELAESLPQSKSGVRILDVRDATEWSRGHIPGATNVFAGALAQGADVDVDPEVTVAVICGSGYRSAVAASLLERQGLRLVRPVPGGMDAWMAAGLPVVKDEIEVAGVALATR